MDGYRCYARPSQDQIAAVKSVGHFKPHKDMVACANGSFTHLCRSGLAPLAKTDLTIVSKN